MNTFMCAMALSTCLVFPALGFNTEVTVNSLKERPVTKVITLLKDMMKQLEKEAEEDEEIYDKMACWCETNDKEKTQSIAGAESRIESLTTKIGEGTAMSSRLNTEIEATSKEVADNQDALDKATAIRKKQLAEFNEEEKDMLQSISALKAAILTLSKHNSASMLQIPQSHMLGVAATLQHEIQEHHALLDGVLTPTEREAIAAFVQAPEDYFDAEPTFKQSYAPQSGEIFGILTTMKETFEANLSQSQKEELANQKAYEDLKAAKEDEIAAGNEQVRSKTEELATTDEKLAQAKEDLDDTKGTLTTDEQFLLMLKEKCSMTDQEWEARQKTRQLEMEAVSKALEVLSGDDAHDLFTKTFNPGFLQEASFQSSDRSLKASKLLTSVAKKWKNSRLVAIAKQLRESPAMPSDALQKVRKAIDEMVENLKKEKQDEIKKKDFCVDEFNKNEVDTERKEREKKEKLAKIEDLEETIKSINADVEVLTSEIAEMQAELKKASDTRQQQHKEFQATVADQRATQKLLEAALKILKGFYDKAAAAALVQKKQAQTGPPPPPGFATYEKNAAAGGVMGMMAKIVADAKAMEAETTRNEEEAQAAYDALVQETEASIGSKNKDLVDKQENLAKAETDLVQTKEEKEQVMFDLERLSIYNAQLKEDCDFTMKNFDLRQTAIDEEIEALTQAKSMILGAKFLQYIQQV